MADLSPHQHKIVERYYRNWDSIKLQQLSELAAELYLSEGKKQERLWKRVEDMLRKMEFPETRISHLLQKRDPTLVVGILKELESSGKS